VFKGIVNGVKRHSCSHCVEMAKKPKIPESDTSRTNANVCQVTKELRDRRAQLDFDREVARINREFAEL
jgi:hypothetical protein